MNVEFAQSLSKATGVLRKTIKRYRRETHAHLAAQRIRMQKIYSTPEKAKE